MADDDIRGKAEYWAKDAIHEPEKRPKTAEEVREALRPFGGVDGAEVPDPEAPDPGNRATWIPAMDLVGDPFVTGTDNGWAIANLDANESDAARLNLAMALAWTGIDRFVDGDRGGAAVFWDRALELVEREPLREHDGVGRQLRSVLRMLPRP